MLAGVSVTWVRGEFRRVYGAQIDSLESTLHRGTADFFRTRRKAPDLSLNHDARRSASVALGTQSTRGR